MEFYTPADCARMLRVRRSRIYAMMAAGQAPSIKIGWRRHVPKAAWDAWCADMSAQALASMKTPQEVAHVR